MTNALLWLYLVNAILLINHEIDSAYWKEWELFKIKGGLSGFLIIHFFLLFAILFGLIEVYKESLTGFIFSFLLCGGGIFAFSIHMFFLKKGRDEFKTTISIAILISNLLVSFVQLGFTIIAIISL